MKIYQLHEYSGEYEYFCDNIIGSYLRKERAEEEKIKAETKEKELIERSKKCNHCPFLESHLSDLDDLLVKHSDYCVDAKLEENKYGIDCDNYFSRWDEATFKIKEIEVEE